MKVIALIDLDCFYVQVERKFNPELINKPCAVVQYNPWKGGGIIALSYEAKYAGVTRGMRGEDAKEICPNIQLITVPEARGKANLSKYRDESIKIIDSIKEFGCDVERASIDEAYVDLTEIINKQITQISLSPIKSMKQLFTLIPLVEIKKLFVDTCLAPSKSICNENDIKQYVEQNLNIEDAKTFISLLYGGIETIKIRDAIFKNNKYQSSAGIAQNKMLAKLGGGLNKPNKQTIVFPQNIDGLYKTIPIKKITGLGGMMGETLMKRYKIQMMSQLQSIPLTKLVSDFGEKHGTWIHNVSLGINEDPVKNRLIPKSIGCGKNFPGKRALVKAETVKHWFSQLVNELIERLEKDKMMNDRSPKTLHIGLGQNINTDTNKVSHQFAFPIYKNPDDLVAICLNNVQKFNSSSNPDSWNPPITNISVTATNFTPDTTTGFKDLSSYVQITQSPSKNKNKIGNLSLPKLSQAAKSPKKDKNESGDLSSPKSSQASKSSKKNKCKCGDTSSTNSSQDSCIIICEDKVGKEDVHKTHNVHSPDKSTPMKRGDHAKTSPGKNESSPLKTFTQKSNKRKLNFNNLSEIDGTTTDKFVPRDWSQVDKSVLDELPRSIRWQIKDNLDFNDMKVKRTSTNKPTAVIVGHKDRNAKIEIKNKNKKTETKTDTKKLKKESLLQPTKSAVANKLAHKTENIQKYLKK